MRIDNFAIEDQLSELLRHTARITMTPDVEGKFYSIIKECFALSVRVTVEPGDMRPGHAWADLGEDVGKLLRDVGIPFIYKAANASLSDARRRAGVEDLYSDWKKLFVCDADFDEHYLGRRVFVLVPYESPMKRIYNSLGPDLKMTEDRSVYVTVWLKK